MTPKPTATSQNAGVAGRSASECPRHRRPIQSGTEREPKSLGIREIQSWHAPCNRYNTFIHLPINTVSFTSGTSSHSAEAFILPRTRIAPRCPRQRGVFHAHEGIRGRSSGPGAPWSGGTGGPQRHNTVPLARRRPSRRALSEARGFQTRTTCRMPPHLRSRGLQRERCGVRESSTLVPQSSRPSFARVPHRRASGGKGLCCFFGP